MLTQRLAKFGSEICSMEICQFWHSDYVNIFPIVSHEHLRSSHNQINLAGDFAHLWTPYLCNTEHSNLNQVSSHETEPNFFMT